MSEPLDLGRIKSYCAKATAGPWPLNQFTNKQVFDLRRPLNDDEEFVVNARTDLPAAIAEIAELRAQLEVARVEKLSLWCGLQKAHDIMVTWFSSEYADSPKANEIRKLIDAYRPE